MLGDPEDLQSSARARRCAPRPSSRAATAPRPSSRPRRGWRSRRPPGSRPARRGPSVPRTDRSRRRGAPRRRGSCRARPFHPSSAGIASARRVASVEAPNHVGFGAAIVDPFAVPDPGHGNGPRGMGAVPRRPARGRGERGRSQVRGIRRRLPRWFGNTTSACCQHRSRAVVDGELRLAPRIRADAALLLDPGRCGQVAGTRSLGHDADLLARLFADEARDGSRRPGEIPGPRTGGRRVDVGPGDAASGSARASSAGHLVASALGAQHLLQAPLELGVAAARGALPEVPLDLHALHADELTIEVELDLAEHVLAVSR